MALKDLNVRKEYRNLKCDVINDFYIPMLSEAVVYKRAVGFFTSEALYDMATGIKHLVLNHGKMEFIVSPHLTDEDIKAIQLGYQKRDEIIEQALLREFNEPTNESEIRKLNLLANLIAEGVLDIKVAFKLETDSIGMYHEKIGVVKDSTGNKIAFTGSMNETHAAFSYNYESIDVFCSWREEDVERVDLKEYAFDNLWANLDSDMEVIAFPKIALDRLNAYKRSSTNVLLEQDNDVVYVKSNNTFFRIPPDVSLHQYQVEAINAWLTKDGCGIFDMATGTGKTFTALGALSYLYERLNDKLLVIIVCPYQHLVEQWAEDIERFNVTPIKAYANYRWKDRVSNLIRSFNLSKDKSYCIVTTNATFSTIEFQTLMTRIKGNTCLVVDEVHNIGASSLRKCLLPNFKYRLGLSATIDRYNDVEGTDAIKQYFGKIVFSYSLEQAIGVFLTEYKYHIVPVYLTQDEWENYSALTYAISNNTREDSNGKTSLTAYGKKLAIKRARLIAGARNKLIALESELKSYVNNSHILVYCGATKMPDFMNSDKSESDQELIKQTNLVMRCIGEKLGMSVSQFTAEEDIETRTIRKEKFISGERQVLVAIKCLDEGVNIPCIKTAFIMASTSNPKEYIQRRGRVLRRFEGKTYSEIYDLVTLPREPESAKSLTIEEMEKEKRLVVRELKRVNEFARLSINKGECYEFINRLRDAYDINLDELNINKSEEED